MSPAASPFLRIIQAGLFAASAATVISGIYVYFLWGFGRGHPYEHIYDIPGGVIAGCAQAIVPAGLFGFTCGIIGGSSLYFLARWIRSLFVLVLASVILGTLLSLSFPFIAFRILGFGSSFDPLMNWDWFLFAAGVGTPVSFLYAMLFRRALLVRSVRPD